MPACPPACLLCPSAGNRWHACPCTSPPRLPASFGNPLPPCRTQSIADYVARAAKVVTLVDLAGAGVAAPQGLHAGWALRRPPAAALPAARASLAAAPRCTAGRCIDVPHHITTASPFPPPCSTQATRNTSAPHPTASPPTCPVRQEAVGRVGRVRWSAEARQGLRRSSCIHDVTLVLAWLPGLSVKAVNTAGLSK